MQRGNKLVHISPITLSGHFSCRCRRVEWICWRRTEPGAPTYWGGHHQSAIPIGCIQISMISLIILYIEGTCISQSGKAIMQPMIFTWKVSPNNAWWCYQTSEQCSHLNQNKDRLSESRPLTNMLCSELSQQSEYYPAVEQCVGRIETAWPWRRASMVHHGSGRNIRERWGQEPEIGLLTCVTAITQAFSHTNLYAST